MPSRYEGGTTFSGASFRSRGRQLSRARNAAVLTRFWQAVEQYRRVPLREVSTYTRSQPGAVQSPSRSAPEPPSTTARPVAQPAAQPFGSELSAAWKCR
jgi:hypothetical protein